MMRAILNALILGAGVAYATFSFTGQAAAQRAAAKTPANVGKQVFDRWCVACHGAGPRYPGTASLAVKYGADMPAALEQRTDLTPELVSYFVRNGVMMMPSFRKTEITDAELESLGAYLSHEE